MDDKIVAIYTIVSDFLMAIHHYEDPQRQMSDAEVMTTDDHSHCRCIVLCRKLRISTEFAG